jgi:N-glycosylase/DNA lyase
LNIIKYKNGYFAENNDYFNPELTFDCGQCFRFKKTEKGFVGVAFNNVIAIEKCEGGHYIYGQNPLELSVLRNFLGCGDEYGEIENILRKDEIIAPALDFGRGIRILRQEFFETLISFIISQQNNIPRITKTVETFARLFGDKIDFQGASYYTFPKAEKLQNIAVSDLEPLKCGYRAKYIIDAVEKVNSGAVSYGELIKSDYITAKNKLLTINGVGSKVADCVCLFSLGQFTAFPTDTWIKKAMDKLYNINEKEIAEKSQTLFAPYPGIAQQHQFYYLRYSPRISTDNIE